MRSRLYPYRAAIEEALVAGTSVCALARTYGCGESTMRKFIGRWLPEQSPACVRAIKDHRARCIARGHPEREDPAYRLRECQYDTLRYAEARQRALEDL